MVDTVRWIDDTGRWNDASAIFAKAKPVEIIGNNFHVVDEIDETLTENIPAMQVILARTGLTIYGRDQEGNPKNDSSILKSVQGIWPEIEAPPGTVIMVSVGFQDVATAPVQWSDPREFIVGQDFWLDFIVTGRYISVKFESNAQPVWVLSRYDLNIEISGER